MRYSSTSSPSPTPRRAPTKPMMTPCHRKTRTTWNGVAPNAFITAISFFLWMETVNITAMMQKAEIREMKDRTKLIIMRSFCISSNHALKRSCQVSSVHAEEGFSFSSACITGASIVSTW